ncbi:FkbM family methyltransferase [Phragmitibacter flavus]|uniref:FkbM family methyltransferase n=1 Tax=Phragmitibacter flavus TaxID=2576071 RepID=A0A5R8KBG9_9BACT|nr:FkbM family methyltransferase [Phragmitibacter flavus]TLD69265.1 FkbM family methyltransferase [Phragmitibacter flavus]
MSKLFSYFPKLILKRFNRTICYCSYPITGCHFRDDLRLVVGKDDPTCFDVGAHWGETIREYQSIFPECIIHSFEPARANLDVLAKLHRPPSVHVHPFALGDENGTSEFTLYEESVLNSFLQIDEAGPKASHQSIGTEKVKVMRLDQFAEDEGVAHIDLLKLDTQGFELAVLRGADRLLCDGRVKAILLELNFDALYQGQCRATEVMDFLQSRGYQLVDFYQKARRGHPLSWCNGLFVRVK